MSVDAPTSSAVESAALARLHDYLRRAVELSEPQELIARDAWMQGFQSGARWTVRTTAALADPRFRECLVALAELLRETEP